MRISALASSVVFFGLVAAAHASPPLTPKVWGGEPSKTCNFPATVALAGWSGFKCSGTLVHPQVVVYAAHCGSDISAIMFGENADSPTKRIVPDRCKVYPRHRVTDGTDWAYCVLPEPVTDVPVTPILMGCERGVLQEGKEVYLVGFGEDDDGNYGAKRQAVAVQHQIEDNKAWIGGDGKDECFGDSGSSAYVQLSADPEADYQGDDTWRVYSITSYTPRDVGAACGRGTFHSLIPSAVPWIEKDSGLDVTPCHDADGTWNPGPTCYGFPREPAVQSGAWETSCQVGATGGASRTCGASYFER